MTALYPTKTRLALLADVDDPANAGVWRHYRASGSINDHTRDGRRVNARMAEMHHAGWVQLSLRSTDARPVIGPRATGVVRQWELTDAGGLLLDQHRRADT